MALDVRTELTSLGARGRQGPVASGPNSGTLIVIKSGRGENGRALKVQFTEDGRRRHPQIHDVLRLTYAVRKTGAQLNKR
jgi:hypothetical protein